MLTALEGCCCRPDMSPAPISRTYEEGTRPFAPLEATQCSQPSTSATTSTCIHTNRVGLERNRANVFCCIPTEGPAAGLVSPQVAVIGDVAIRPVRKRLLSLSAHDLSSQQVSVCQACTRR